MKVSFEGIGEMVATFEVSGTVVPGDMVKLDGDGKVSACGDGDEFVGVAVTVREGCAGVQFAGMAQVSCDGELTCGWKKLVADGKGGIKTAAASGREYLVVAVDSTAKTAVVRL